MPCGCCGGTATVVLNPLTPNDPYRGRTAPLTSKSCILYIYSTNVSTQYFKNGIHFPFYSLQNAVCFIIQTYLAHALFTFYIQGVIKLKKIIPAPKGLTSPSDDGEWLAFHPFAYTTEAVASATTSQTRQGQIKAKEKPLPSWY